MLYCNVMMSLFYNIFGRDGSPLPPPPTRWNTAILFSLVAWEGEKCLVTLRILFCWLGMWSSCYNHVLAMRLITQSPWKVWNRCLIVVFSCAKVILTFLPTTKKYAYRVCITGRLSPSHATILMRNWSYHETATYNYVSATIHSVYTIAVFCRSTLRNWRVFWLLLNTLGLLHYLRQA